MMGFARLAVAGLLIGGLLHLTACCCGASAGLQGTVVDEYGQLLPGVEVSMVDTEFTTTTDESGVYELGYTPGRFELRFTAVGYSGARLKFDVQREVAIPVRQVELWHLPPHEGIFVAAEQGYQPLVTTSVSTAGTWLESRNGLKSPSRTPVLDDEPRFVFMGKTHTTTGMSLSLMEYSNRIKVQNMFGRSRVKTNMWLISGDDLDFDVSQPDPDTPLFVVTPVNTLAPGLYAFHWGVLDAQDPFTSSASSRKAVFDFEIPEDAPAEPAVELGQGS